MTLFLQGKTERKRDSYFIGTLKLLLLFSFIIGACSPLPLYGQNVPEKDTRRVITGKVLDEEGHPLAGASIRLKGHTSMGSMADSEGRFILQLPLLLPGVQNQILVVSFLGMETQEVTIGNKNNFNIKLRNSSQQINEVVVTTGYQDIPKERMTGAISVVTASDLQNSAFSSIDALLDGKVAGLYSSMTNGSPGARSEIRIRGDNSISGNMEPLWVLDGLPLQSGVMSINGTTSGNIQQSILDHGIGTLAPGDIESVTVLKDAAATAIYGARAANGVIVIKTKQGSEGPLMVNYQGSYGVTMAPRMTSFDFMNAEQKVNHEIELMEEFRLIGGLGRAGMLWEEWQRGAVSSDYYHSEIDRLKKVRVNWFDEIFHSSFAHNHNLSLRGGTDKYWFYTSVNVTRESGALKTNSFSQFGASTNIGFRLHKDVKLDLRLNGSYRESNDHASAIDPFAYAVFANPYEQPYNEDGSYAWDLSYLNSNISNLHSGYVYPTFNILREMNETKSQNIAADMGLSTSLNWQLLPELKAEFHGRINYSTNNGETQAKSGTYTSLRNYYSKYPFDTGKSTVEIPEEYNRGYLRVNSGRSHSFSARTGLSYNKSFEATHHLTAYLGAEVASNENWNNMFRAAQFETDYLFVSFPDYLWTVSGSSNFLQDLGRMSNYVYGGRDRTASFFGALTYSYQDRYVLNFNARVDGASTIEPDNRFVPLWSISGRWNLHRETFIKKNLPFFSGLAIRMVYGFTGNIDRTALPYPYLLINRYLYDNEYLAQRVFYPNPNIKWEKKEDRSIGVDYSFFDNIIGGSFNYYYNTSRDVLGVISAPNSSLNTRPKVNSHMLTNIGYELILNLRIPIGRDFRWITQFNVGQNKNKITKSTFPRIENFENDDLTNLWAGYAGAIEGYETGATFGYRFSGVDPLTGNAMIKLSQKAREAYAVNKNVDISTIPQEWDPSRDPGLSGITWDRWLMYSMEVIGKQSPQYTGGITSTLTWKNMELRAAFSYATGHIVRSFDERNAYSQYVGVYVPSELHISRLNRLATAVNRWRMPGDITNYPRYGRDNTRYMLMYTDDKFEKGDFLNFRDLSFTYNVKGKIVQQFGIQYLKLGLQAQNLFVWSTFQSIDAATRVAFGYPRTRKYLMNIQLTF